MVLNFENLQGRLQCVKIERKNNAAAQYNDPDEKFCHYLSFLTPLNFFALFLTAHKLTACLVTLGRGLGEGVLQLGPLLHRALASVVPEGFVYNHGGLLLRMRKSEHLFLVANAQSWERFFHLVLYRRTAVSRRQRRAVCLRSKEQGLRAFKPSCPGEP
jgi:hypothetical protein